MNFPRLSSDEDVEEMRIREIVATLDSQLARINSRISPYRSKPDGIEACCIEAFRLAKASVENLPWSADSQIIEKAFSMIHDALKNNINLSISLFRLQKFFRDKEELLEKVIQTGKALFAVL